MLFDTCRFCEHVNPPDAKFCNACGGALHLVPCSRCGAVNDVTATACFECHGPLPGRGTGTPEIVSQLPAPVEPPKVLPRSHVRVFVGAGVFAVIAVVGFLGFRQASHLGAAQSEDASGRAESRDLSGGPSVLPGSAMAGGIALVKRDDSVRPVRIEGAQLKVPFSGAVTAPESRPRDGQQAVASQVAKVATAPVVRAKVANEGKADPRETPRLEPCTETVAALGLCALKPVQEARTESAATMKPVIARSKAGDGSKAGRQEARRKEACTEGAAALGLCTARPTQEGK